MWQPAIDDPSGTIAAKKANREKRQERSLAIVVYASVFAFCVLALPAYHASYRAVDDFGLLEHSHDTPVWIGGEWLTNEYRICQMPGTLWGKLPDTAHLLCGSGEQSVNGVWPAGFRNKLSPQEYNDLFEQWASNWQLVDHYFHVLPVEYWGRIDRSDRPTYSWRCQRQASGLECKALN